MTITYRIQSMDEGFDLLTPSATTYQGTVRHSTHNRVNNAQLLNAPDWVLL